MSLDVRHGIDIVVTTVFSCDFFVVFFLFFILLAGGGRPEGVTGWG